MRTRADYNWHSSGRQAFWDVTSYESLLALYPCQFYDDFKGPDVVIPADGSDQSGCKWTKKIVAAAGAPTVAKVANDLNGVVACTLAVTAEKEDACLHMDDQLTFSVAQGAIFEARVRLSVLPSEAEVVAAWGLHGAWGDGGSAYRVGFEATGNGLVYCESDDNATDTAATSGVTVTAAQWKIYRIDCTVQTDIKFYIDGVGVATGTTFANAAAAPVCQPHFGMYKASAAGLGTMLVDYVKIWQNRS